MFTGIISHIGTIRSIDIQGDWRFTVSAEDFTQSLALGASIACSGVCLTATDFQTNNFTVQVSAETRACTTLGGWKQGTRINLERALRVGDELGGHFVSGHVDGLAVLENKSQAGDSWTLEFAAPKALSRYIAKKGSVTLDGVSLTVNALSINNVADARFSVNIIPHTLTATTLGERSVGDRVNLEIDLLARYLMRLNEQ